MKVFINGDIRTQGRLSKRMTRTKLDRSLWRMPSVVDINPVIAGGRGAYFWATARLSMADGSRRLISLKPFFLL